MPEDPYEAEMLLLARQSAEAEALGEGRQETPSVSNGKTAASIFLEILF